MRRNSFIIERPLLAQFFLFDLCKIDTMTDVDAVNLFR